tara:strand:- start:678 stop:989 length:312 start_codon:yes stop_codon:yes gene_type:complete
MAELRIEVGEALDELFIVIQLIRDRHVLSLIDGLIGAIFKILVKLDAELEKHMAQIVVVIRVILHLGFEISPLLSILEIHLVGEDIAVILQIVIHITSHIFYF